jgi:hypothetical protein
MKALSSKSPTSIMPQKLKLKNLLVLNQSTSNLRVTFSLKKMKWIQMMKTHISRMTTIFRTKDPIKSMRSRKTTFLRRRFPTLN